MKSEHRNLPKNVVCISEELNSPTKETEIPKRQKAQKRSLSPRDFSGRGQDPMFT